MSTPVICLNISADMCSDVPLPDEPALSLPGLALASAMNSWTELTPSAGGTTMMLGWITSMVIGLKSLIGSNGMLRYSVGLMPWVPIVMVPSV